MGRYSKLDVGTHLQAILAGGGREDPPARTTRSVRRLRRLNDLEVDALVTRYQSGERIVDLARGFGMHRTTISAQLTARGVLVPTRRLSPEEEAEVVRRYQAGWSTARAAKHFGMSESVIARVLKRARVVPRRVGTNQWSPKSCH